LVALTLLAVRLVPKHRYLTVGWFWFLGTLVPVIGVVQVGEQAMADRYTYIPYIGLFVLVCWSAEALAGGCKVPKVFMASAALCLIATLLVSMHMQTLYWRNTETLFRHAVEVTGDNPTAQEALAGALSQAGKQEEAEQHCLEALRLRRGFTEAQITYASVLAREGRFSEAYTYLVEVLRKGPPDAAVRYRLAQIFSLCGDTTRAVEQYSEGLRLQADQPEALNNLAWIRATHPNLAFRNGDEAVRLAERACELTRYARPLMIGTLAAAYAEAGRFDDAVQAANKARLLALASGLKELANKNQQLGELYRAHHPYHDQLIE
jgi:hypothetical protein